MSIAFENAEIPLPAIGEKAAWRPRGGELFIHSHFSEPQDGSEADGIPADPESGRQLFELVSKLARSGAKKDQVRERLLEALTARRPRTTGQG